MRRWQRIAAGEEAATAEADYFRFCQKIAVDRSILRQANLGSEKMSEQLLADVRRIATEYRWRNPDGDEVPFLTDDELANLSIRSGTLNGDEREIINHHIVATIRMLEQLPWPKHLSNVPEYAGGHHERMDGKGYPRGLKRDEMSWQARIMGIADIFEALTAEDRPYKGGMKLSQALAILDKFSRNGHIDPDLHRIFVDSAVYRRYAEAYLKDGQVDC